MRNPTPFAHANKTVPATAFHAGTLAFYPLLLLILSVWCEHPLFLVLLLAVTLFGVVKSGGFRVWLGMMRYAWLLLGLVFLLNVLITKDGATVLYNGPHVPVFGQLRVTGEAMMFALVMVLRLLVVTAAASLYIAWLSPDRALGLVAKVAGRSAVTAMLAARLLPYLAEQAKSVGDVMQTRGVRFQEGSLRKRLAARKSMMNVLLVSSLEGSWQVAEAMEARGFGTGTRTAYTRERWTRRDLLAWLTMLLALVLMVWLDAQDLLSYTFYPRLAGLADGGSVAIGGMVLLNALLLLPPMLGKRRRR